jgi:hypothetical protein
MKLILITAPKLAKLISSPPALKVQPLEFSLSFRLAMYRCGLQQARCSDQIFSLVYQQI